VLRGLGGLGTRVRRSLVAAAFILSVLSSSAGANHNLVERVSVGPTGGNGPFYVNAESSYKGGVSTDGRHIFFETPEQLTAADTDSSVDVYDRDPVAGTTTLISIGSQGGNGASDAGFEGASADGSHVFFSTAERLVSEDKDGGVYDIYERYAGSTTLTSTGPHGSSSAPLFHYGSFKVSSDGTHAFFHTTERLVPADNDNWLDIYARSSGVTQLVSVGIDNRDAWLPGTYGTDAIKSISDDGTRVFFDAFSSLAPEDNDNCPNIYGPQPCNDVYERNLATGTTTLVSTGPLEPTSLDSDAWFSGISDDGSRAFFRTIEALTSNDLDADPTYCSPSNPYGCQDVYERNLTTGTTTLVSTGPTDPGPVSADFAGSSGDGTHVFFTSDGAFTSDDTDFVPGHYCSLESCHDLYERYAGTTRLVSTGPTDPQSSYDDYIVGSNNTLAGTSADSTHVFFNSYLKLTPDDLDRCDDIYERVGNTTSLVSTGPTDGDAGYWCEPTFRGASADGSRAFFTTPVPLVAEDSDFGDVNSGCRFYGDDEEYHPRPCYDVYERRAGTTTLLSRGPNQSNGPFDASFQGASDDGRLVSIVTGERLTFDDTDIYPDVFAARIGYPQPPYETPQSASSIQVSLVPAFKPCGTGGNPTNAKHAPPLASSSCTPPKPSLLAVVGTSSQGSAQMTVVPGDSDPTNGNQANVSLTAALSDIQATGGGDYNPNPTGADLTAVTRLRFTDLANGSGGVAATATEYDFRVPIDCTSTPDPSVGSTCSANTTANALVPGLIQEAQQAVVQAFRVRIDDSGANGIRGDSDDRIFATQGVFVP
jgi:hypothetical protein